MIDARKMPVLNIWAYQARNGTSQRGAMLGFTDRGDTGVSYRSHRIDDSGKPIVYDNGGFCLDIISGYALKKATRIGNGPNPEACKD